MASTTPNVSKTVRISADQRSAAEASRDALLIASALRLVRGRGTLRVSGCRFRAHPRDLLPMHLNATLDLDVIAIEAQDQIGILGELAVPAVETSRTTAP